LLKINNNTNPANTTGTMETGFIVPSSGGIAGAGVKLSFCGINGKVVAGVGASGIVNITPP